jgi:hypothetical protein
MKSRKAMSDADVGVVLEWALAGAPGMREVPESAPQDNDLVAYLSGTLAPAEAARIEQGLVAHRTARRRLVEIAEQLDALQARPWPAASVDGIVAAWRRLVETNLAASTSVRDPWQVGGWERVRAGVSAGQPELRAAWIAFQGFAAQWKRARSMPQWAVARGGSVAPALLPEGVSLMLDAEIAGGDLMARAEVCDAAGQASAVLDGRILWLNLAMESDAWPLAAASVRAGAAVWRLASAGTALGLSEGPLLPGDVAVTLNPAITLGPTAVRSLAAASGKGPTARVELRGWPQIVAGRLCLTVGLPALTRKAHAGGDLSLSVAVTPTARQWLGAWPVTDWSDDPRPLEAPCPGPDGDFDPALLEFDLVPRSERGPDTATSGSSASPEETAHVSPS